MVAEVEAVVEVEVGAVVVTAHSWVLHQTRAIDRIKTQALQTGCLGELVLCLKTWNIHTRFVITHRLIVIYINAIGAQFCLCAPYCEKCSRRRQFHE